MLPSRPAALLRCGLKQLTLCDLVAFGLLNAPEAVREACDVRAVRWLEVSALAWIEDRREKHELLRRAAAVVRAQLPPGALKRWQPGREDHPDRWAVSPFVWAVVHIQDCLAPMLGGLSCRHDRHTLSYLAWLADQVIEVGYPFPEAVRGLAQALAEVPISLTITVIGAVPTVLPDGPERPLLKVVE